MQNLKGKAAIVTGGSRGIGRATARALAEHGCRVAICGRNVANLKKAEQELGSSGADVFAMPCDLSEPMKIRKFAATVKKRFGHVDILVNNAGVMYYETLAEAAEERTAETIDVNVRGLILMTKHLLPLMKKDSIIINISSGAGKSGYPGLAAYCASKYAVLGFTEALAGELKGIKVVAVCPGGVDTDMYMGMSSRRPALKPEHIAAKIVEICAQPEKFRSGSSVDVYHVTDALNHLRLKYFGKHDSP